MIKKETPEGYACIFVREMAVKMRIGLHVSEAKPQPVAVTVELYADPVAYLNKVSEDSLIDYQRIHDAVMEWPARPHVRLIETCVRELLDLAFGFKAVTVARVSVGKPEIFKAANAVGVEVFLTRAEYTKLK